MNNEDIVSKCKEIHKKCWKLFNYVHDEKQYMVIEHWASHAEEVEANKTFTDDCDGYALTCAELLIKAGVPQSQVTAVYCVTETDEGHLVCGVNVNETTMILDNRYDHVYDWANRSDYQWELYMNFGEKGKWRKVTNAVR